MPDLCTSLQGKDLGFLRIIAEHWELEFDAPDARIGLQRIIPQMLDKENILDLIERLPSDTRSALEDLFLNDAKLSWSLFIRRHGDIRDIGPGKRDRERPDLNPLSATEHLWYLGLIFRSTLDTPDGPQEFAYIPEDFIQFIPAPTSSNHIFFGKPAALADCQFILEANDGILDDSCTYLAALRSGLGIHDYSLLDHNLIFIKSILSTTEIITPKGTPNAAATRKFLENPRAQAFLLLAYSWLNSTINDLLMVPSLVFEGHWQNDPLQTRKTLLNLIKQIPESAWWNINSFIQAIHQQFPNFQRTSGDYSSWYIRDAITNEYLSGDEHWLDVEGAYIFYLITGPLFWLGFLDLAKPKESDKISAFRLSRWFNDIFINKIPIILTEEKDMLVINTDGHLFLSSKAPRAVRYQIARSTQWMGIHHGQYHYVFTPNSLHQAKKQGLTVQHLISLIHQYSHSLPPNLINALKRWDEFGAEAVIQHVSLLRVNNPEIIEKLRKSDDYHYIIEEVNANIVMVNKASINKLLASMARMGYLGEEESS